MVEEETRGMSEEDEERWRRRKTRSSDGSDVLSIWGRETKRERRGDGGSERTGDVRASASGADV